ncbi:hypothetical protein CAPTEDRAFT_195320 [Capitella teleta]|uniref:Uncharacterized protein n=1 Tax=Capitella teleta TaxID=283909 RepID=R7TDC1_CAPTE|nr:hypothetical protein CAPTEDRAFT_195320 [Capitella teleta]|eukprot:ELT91497.1 hypothetical protein CAPTEDRAFT_195320 [Capitella teleta]
MAEEREELLRLFNLPKRTESQRWKTGPSPGSFYYIMGHRRDQKRSSPDLMESVQASFRRPTSMFEENNEAEELLADFRKFLILRVNRVSLPGTNTGLMNMTTRSDDCDCDMELLRPPADGQHTLADKMNLSIIL